MADKDKKNVVDTDYLYGDWLQEKVKGKKAATSGFRKTKKAAGEQTRQETYDKADFYGAKRRGKGIYSPAEKKRIKAWEAGKKARAKAFDRKVKVQSKKGKKASTRMVKRSKGYA